METGVAVYTSMGPSWNHFGKPRAKRPLESIVLDEGVAEGLVADLEQFIQAKKW
jgi:mitochondrial chaperone BCS1